MKQQARGTIWLVFALVMLWILSNGYRFGTDNHNEQLPIIARLLETHFLRNDWLVNANDHFTHRTPYSWLISWPARLLGLEAACALVFLVTLLALAFGVFRLGRALWQEEENRDGAALCGVAIVLFNTFSTLGNSSLLASMIVPGLIAAALCVWAMAWLLEGKPWHAAATLLLAGVIHALIGPETALLIAIASLAAKSISGTARRAWPLWLLAMAGPLLLAWLSQRDNALTAAQAQEATRLLVFVRHPWHYVPWTWPMED